MPSLIIDQLDGTVTLPNGHSIGSTLTQDAFRSNHSFADAESKDYGTLPYIHYKLSGGQINGKPLLVSICFYDQLLLYIDLTADLYPLGPKDWSKWSLEIEAETKQFHDRLLNAMFGKPSTGGSFLFGHVPKLKSTLDHPLRWTFPWGTVFSSYDSKGGGTSITIRYGNRMEDANKAYGSRRSDL